MLKKLESLFDAKVVCDTERERGNENTNELIFYDISFF